MSTPAEIVQAHYEAQARQASAAMLSARRLWRSLNVDDLDRSWAKIVDRLTLLVASAQLGAATAGAAYVPLALGAANADPPAPGSLVPRRWAGVASDGRALDTLLFGSVVRVREAFAAGLRPGPSMEAGQKQLDLLIRTQVADAGRGAAGAAVAAREHVGYTRLVSPPCCQRCAILAGKQFRWNEGFKRHPQCDCRHVPQADGHPSGYTADITADEVRDLTVAQRRAISDGADMNQVINAHRAGRRSRDGMTTSEGSTRRRKGQQAPARLTPEGIYRVSATRDEAIARLRTNGYLL